MILTSGYNEHTDEHPLHPPCPTTNASKKSHEEVAETLESPDELLPGDHGGHMAIKRYGNREVRVVYVETEAETFLIYTVMKPRIHQKK